MAKILSTQKKYAPYKKMKQWYLLGIFHTYFFLIPGRQFDHVGNINQWWDHESSEKFHNKAQCIIDQYNGYKVEEVGIYLNGLNTQGENIADNGGIKQSFYVRFFLIDF